MAYESQYSEAILKSMQEIFGEGFLSPGGAAEVARILAPHAPAGGTVLDWGCGIGGTAIALARHIPGASVLGIDVEQGSLARASANVAAAGLTERVRLKLVAPGPLPLADSSFDLVFSKEAICHIEDKAPIFAEIFRVLRPGGAFLGSDWMTGSDHPGSESYSVWTEDLRDSGLSFHFYTAAAHSDAFAAAGFQAIEVIDDSAWTAREAERHQAHSQGPGRAALVEALGPEGLDGFLQRARARSDALANGDLRRYHMRAHKPAAEALGASR